MIKEFTKVWFAHKGQIEAAFKAKHPDNYLEIVTAVVQMLYDHIDDYQPRPDPKRIHEIDDGDYQGTLVYVIGRTNYQPSDYWYTKVSYGSCSGCDTLQAISEYSSEPPTEEQAKEYVTLALHLLQRMKLMDDSEVESDEVPA